MQHYINIDTFLGLSFYYVSVTKPGGPGGLPPPPPPGNASGVVNTRYFSRRWKKLIYDSEFSNVLLNIP